MFLDFAIISALLVASHLIRASVPLLQRLFIPAPILAGLLGLLGSEQCFGVLPFSRTDSGAVAMTAYPFELVAILFATLFMGHREHGVSFRSAMRGVSQTSDTFFYNLAAEIGQYGFALLFGLLVMATLFPELDPGFAVMLPAGFVGGHGTATVVGGVLQQQGWDDALTVGYTFATIGLLSGILGGLVLVNVATRRGWTRLVQSPGELPESVRRGFLPIEQREPMGTGTVSSMSLDPLAWHVALVLSVFGAAHGINHLAQSWGPGNYSLPLFAVAMLVGAGTQILLELCGLGQFVDRQVIARIGSTVSDYLVTFGVASISIHVVVEYALPLTVMSVFGILYAMGMLLLVGRRLFHNFWFERSIFVYGWSTGVVAIGILLLRIVDPKMRSRTLEDYGVAYTVISVLEIVLLVVLPPLIASRVIAMPAIVLVGLFAGCLILSRLLVGWFKQSPHEQRPGEDESMMK